MQSPVPPAMNSPESAPLDQFRAAVSADPALERRLGGIAEMMAFIGVAVEEAAARGITLDPVAVERAFAPDPLGLDRFLPKPITGEAIPGPAWLPAAIVEAPSGLAIDWFYLGDNALSDPFFEDSLRQARYMPISRLIRHRTPLATLPEAVGAAGAVPDGLIFHLSRCGSTLVAQMIAALPGAVVVSEPAPFDWVLQYAQNATDQPIEQRLALIRAMAAALGRRAVSGQGFVIKLDCWHTVALPLLRQAFPHTPWIFLYRDPLEIMASQFRMRGLQTVRGGIGPSVFGITEEGLSEEAYCACVLERTCAPILDADDTVRGLLINYTELPGAVEAAILPHFGIELTDAARPALAAAAGRDAKAPRTPFAPDSAEKQREASAAVRAAVTHYLAEPYRRLEMLRTGGQSSRRASESPEFRPMSED